MSGSSVTPKTAGMESTANKMSLSSTAIMHIARGVASQAPVSALSTNSLSPWYLSVVGRLFKMPMTKSGGFSSPWSSSSEPDNPLYAAKRRNAANTSNRGSKLLTADRPTKMKNARRITAPQMPRFKQYMSVIRELLRTFGRRSSTSIVTPPSAESMLKMAWESSPSTTKSNLPSNSRNPSSWRRPSLSRCTSPAFSNFSALPTLCNKAMPVARSRSFACSATSLSERA
mmetsp:Transcript_172622/g.548140  ORF Transcript_172622/g.548140 Transcript_172622/m.548140 type:complete len:229 (-) Transcript_172622:439-1125(-)